MGDARRKRLSGIGPTHLIPNVDLDATIAEVERLVEAGQVKGFVQIALLEHIAPGVSPVKMFTMGVEKREAYDMLCAMKKGMEDTMGFREDDPHG